MADADIKKSIEKVPGATVQQVKDFLTAIKVKLELKSDKTYTLGQGAGNLEGTWAYKDMKITLTPTKGGGMSKEEALKLNPAAKSQFDPMTLDSDKDMKTLTGNAPSAPGLPAAQLSFTRGSTEPAASNEAPKSKASASTETPKEPVKEPTKESKETVPNKK